MALEQESIERAYELAVREKMSIYDTLFIILAKQLNVELKTLDKKQLDAFNSARY